MTTVEALYQELYRVQDTVNELDPVDPHFEATIEYLEDCAQSVLEELRLAGEQV